MIHIYGVGEFDDGDPYFLVGFIGTICTGVDVFLFFFFLFFIVYEVKFFREVDACGDLVERLLRRALFPTLEVSEGIIIPSNLNLSRRR